MCFKGDSISYRNAIWLITCISNEESVSSVLSRISSLYLPSACLHLVSGLSLVTLVHRVRLQTLFYCFLKQTKGNIVGNSSNVEENVSWNNFEITFTSISFVGKAHKYLIRPILFISDKIYSKPIVNFLESGIFPLSKSVSLKM